MKFLIALASLSMTITTFACPDLNDVDLAGEEDKAKYTELSSTNLKLTKEEFVKIPAFDADQYEYCKDALVVQTIKANSTGNIYKSVLTYEDGCDGGNSYGALFDEDMKKILGDIGDSYISCY